MLEKLTEDLNIISQLSNKPNTEDGMDAPELKAKFDEAGLKIQTYLNALIDILNDTASDNLGIGNIEGFEDCETITDAIVKLQNSVIGSFTGQIPANSITTEKLRSRGQDGTGGITSIKLAVAAIEAINIAARAITSEKLSRKTDQNGAAVKRENIEANAVGRDEIQNGEVINEKIANGISGNKISSRSIPANTVAQRSIKGVDIALNEVKDEHMLNGSIHYNKLYPGETQQHHIQLKITLPAGSASWTVAAQGVTANSLVIAQADISTEDVWDLFQIRNNGQSANTLTFIAKNGATNANCVVNVAVFN